MFNRIDLSLQPSWRLAAILGLPFCLASLLLYTKLSAHLLGIALYALLPALGCYYAMRFGRLSCKLSACAIKINGDASEVVFGSGERLAIKVLPNALITPFCCILQFETSKIATTYKRRTRKRHSMIICRFNCNDQTAWRRLRVLLNVGYFEQSSDQIQETS